MNQTNNYTNPTAVLQHHVNEVEKRRTIYALHQYEMMKAFKKGYISLKEFQRFSNYAGFAVRPASGCDYLYKWFVKYNDVKKVYDFSDLLSYLKNEAIGLTDLDAMQSMKIESDQDMSFEDAMKEIVEEGQYE